MRFDPLCFTFKETTGHFAVRVGFNVGEEGVAFAEHFNARAL